MNALLVQTCSGTFGWKSNEGGKEFSRDLDRPKITS